MNNDKDWDAIARIISKVFREGIEYTDGIAFKKYLEVGKEIVEVSFAKVGHEKLIRISNAWVRSLKKTSN